MATSPWYREGTAKFTEGSTTVTGTGTRWVDFVRAGDGIQGPDGKLYQVTNVASNTSMSITPAYGSETTYWTIPIQGYVKRLADAASQLVRDFEGGADEALDAADRAQQSAAEASASEAAALSQANRAESEADRAETEADRAQQAADDAVAVVTDGGGSIDPEAGKWPVAGAEGTIKQAWVHELEFALDKLRVATNKALYGEGPYPDLDFQFQGADMLDPRIEFTRASVDWDEEGNEYGIDEPVLTDKGLWVSGARTNLLVWSDDVSGEGWGWIRSSDFYTVTKFQATGLLDGMNANKILVTTDTESLSTILPTQTLSLETGKNYSFSFFVSKDFGSLSHTMIELGVDARNSFDVSEGKMVRLSENVVDSKVEDLGLWYRVHLTFTHVMDIGRVGVSPRRDSGFGYNQSYFAGEYAIYSGFMLTEGVGDTPYIPTEDSQVTVADSTLNSIETDRLRSVVIDLELLRNVLDSNTLYILSWGSNRTGGIPTNGIMVWAQSATQIQARVYNSGSFVSQNIPCVWEDLRRLGISISGDRVIFSANGQTAEIQTSEDVLSKARFANLYPVNTNQSKYRWLKSAAFYERALTAEQLQELTS